MKKYALTLCMPDFAQNGFETFVDTVAEKFGASEIKDYPVHIPIKYGFLFDDEEKLIAFIRNFNKSLTSIAVSVTGLRGNDKIFHLGVDKNQALKDMQTLLQEKLVSDLGLDLEQIRDGEKDPNYEFHLSLAKSSTSEDKQAEIKEFLVGLDNRKEFSFSFTAVKIGVIVKEGDRFVKVEIK